SKEIQQQQRCILIIKQLAVACLVPFRPRLMQGLQQRAYQPQILQSAHDQRGRGSCPLLGQRGFRCLFFLHRATAYAMRNVPTNSVPNTIEGQRVWGVEGSYLNLPDPAETRRECSVQTNQHVGGEQGQAVASVLYDLVHLQETYWGIELS